MFGNCTSKVVLLLTITAALNCLATVPINAAATDDKVQFSLSYEEKSSSETPSSEASPGIGSGGGFRGAIDKAITSKIQDGAGAAGGNQTNTSRANLVITIAPLVNPSPAAVRSNVTLEVQENSWTVDDKMPAAARSQLEGERSDVLAKLRKWTSTLTDQQVNEMLRSGLVKLPVRDPFSELKKLSKPDVSVSVSGPKTLQVALDQVDDRQWKARLQKLLNPIEELGKKMTGKEQALAELRNKHDDLGIEIERVVADIAAAQRTLVTTSEDISHFGPGALKDVIAKTESTIADLKRQVARYTDSYLRQFPNERRQRDFLLATIKVAEENLAAMRRGAIDPDNSLFPENIRKMGKTYLETLKQLQSLSERQHNLIEQRAKIQAEINEGVELLAGWRKDLSKLWDELHRNAVPSIEQVDVSIETENVFRAVFSPRDAERVEALRELNDRVNEEWPRFDRIRGDRKKAEEALKAQAKSTRAAAEKLSGLTGAIMVNSYAHAGAEVTEVALAFRKGGLFGSLEETLKKASEFAINYVSSGGKDVGYEGVDEKKIEEEVKQSLQPGSAPWKVNDILMKAGDWATGKVSGAAEKAVSGFIPDTIVKRTVGCAVAGSLKKDFSSQGKNIDAARERLMKYLDDAAEPGTAENALNINKNSAFNKLHKDLAESAVEKLISAGIKGAGAAYEKAAWENYFRQEIRLRIVFEAYRRLNAIYKQEDALFSPVLEARDSLASRSPCERQDAFSVVLDKAFAEANAQRRVTVAVKTASGASTGEVSVFIQHILAKFARPDRHEGSLAAGTPSDKKLHVSLALGE